MIIPALALFAYISLQEDEHLLNNEWFAISNCEGYDPFYGPILPTAVVNLCLIGPKGKSIVEGVLSPSFDVLVNKVISGVEVPLPAIYRNPFKENLLIKHV